MKNDIRNKLILKRRNLPKTVKRKLDRNLNECLEETFDWMNIHEGAKILGFYPILKQNEVDILPFLEYLLENKINLYFPRINKDELEIIKVDNLDNFSLGKFDILEPNKELLPSNETNFDLILVPGVGFCKNCQRIGYGKGYYDKLLKNINGTKIGIAYEFQILDDLPSDDHDVRLDIIVTEAGIYK